MYISARRLGLLNENKVIRDLTDNKWEEFVNYVLLFMEGIDDDNNDIYKAISLFHEEFKTYFYTDQQPRLQYDDSSRVNL